MYKLLYKDEFNKFYNKMVIILKKRLNSLYYLSNNNSILDIYPITKENPFKIIIKNYNSGMLLFLSQCAICGSTDEINMHHVKHIRKMGKEITGSTKLLAQVNRKKIIVCKKCQQKIHKGIYDDINLANFANPSNIGFSNI